MCGFLAGHLFCRFAVAASSTRRWGIVQNPQFFVGAHGFCSPISTGLSIVRCIDPIPLHPVCAARLQVVKNCSADATRQCWWRTWDYGDYGFLTERQIQGNVIYNVATLLILSFANSVFFFESIFLSDCLGSICSPSPDDAKIEESSDLRCALGHACLLFGLHLGCIAGPTPRQPLPLEILSCHVSSGHLVDMVGMSANGGFTSNLWIFMIISLGPWQNSIKLWKLAVYFRLHWKIDSVHSLLSVNVTPVWLD